LGQFYLFGACPKRGENGKAGSYTAFGNAKMAGIEQKILEKCAYGIFKKGQEFFGIECRRCRPAF